MHTNFGIIQANPSLYPIHHIDELTLASTVAHSATIWTQRHTELRNDLEQTNKHSSLGR